MTNETLEILKRRRSVRAYAAKPLDREALEAIVEAGQYAPNGGGAQQWHFAAVTDPALLERINAAAKAAARQSGIPHLAALGADPAFHTLYSAPALVLVASDPSNPAAQADCACAVENMLIAAESIGVAGCFLFFPSMAFQSQDADALRAQLAIPEGYQVFYTACFGHPAAPADPPPPRREGTVTWS